MFGRDKNKLRKGGDSKRKLIRTLISEGCVVDGSVYASTSVRVDGHIKGSLDGKSTLIVGEKGLASGEIKALEVIIFGAVEGTVEAQKVEIKVGGSVMGDVITKSLIVEDGATYNGKCFMDSSSAKAETLTEQVQVQTPQKIKVRN